MKNHKLFVLLAHLTQSEKRDLEKFLRSDLFNKRKTALDLFLFLQKTAGIPNKSDIFKALFPDKKFKDSSVRLVMSQLVKNIEAFLVYQCRVQEDLKHQTILAQIYQQKNLPQLAERVLDKTLMQQEKNALRNGDYYFQRYDLNLKSFDYATSKRTKGQNLPEVSANLDTAFLILKLQQACSALSYQAVNKTEMQTGLLPLVLPYIETNELTKVPAIGIYYHCYLALKGQAEKENFAQFKSRLFQYQHHFPKEEWSNLFLFGTNICIKIINSGDLTFLKEILELYKEGLATEALLNNGILSRFTYQNIVTSAIRTDELAWAKQFLLHYREKVEKTYRASAFRFNMARLAYAEMDYTTAIDLLRDTDQGDLLINLYAKNLLLKIYYETGEFKLLNSFLDAFQIYLRRKKEISSHKKNYWNMIYYTQKLMKVNPFNKAAKIKLAQRIEAEEVLLERKWLLNQLARL
ncbi:MAG: hypothetical protein AAGJ18_01035 [Bacteroidota bacterium]